MAVALGRRPNGEVRLAQLIVDAFPAMDMVRMVNSGTEATMTAIRLARGLYGARHDCEICRLLSRSRR